jgi:glycosyltransferase involved in cell wall biosynthesis
MTDISVVICAYTEKRWNELSEAVQSLQNQSLPPGEVILVIDHNQTLLERARARFSNIVILESQEVHGLAGARNTGIERARGEIIAFLDDDAVAAPNWLELLSASYEDSNVIGVGGELEPLWPQGRPRWFPEEFDWVVGCTYRGLPKQRAPVRNLIGANMSFRREVFDQVQFYSGIGHTANNPFGGSDPDFCIRVNQCFPDKILLYEPQALVYHHVDEKRTYWNYFCLRCYNEGLSKSVLTRRVGSQVGLSSERAYTLRTLPMAALQGLVDTFQGDGSGLSRTIAILGGFTITTTGYLVGVLRQKLQSWRSMFRRSSVQERVI